MHDPDQVACFEDHFVLIDEATVPDAVKAARLAPARQLAAEMVEADGVGHLTKAVAEASGE